ncbi:MAG: acylneuraminate cytidylyltransferase family protein [Armatimonadetes bacterium]|nr:acylneuraminate cytidylyltransferase family protein [Armatimonadota bacterium]
MLENNFKIAAMVKARGGSVGLPGKNIKHFCGKPLIAWAIETAKKCKDIDYVFVSTDSEEIASIAREYGADIPFIRPDYLAVNTAHDGEVLLHAVDFLEKEKNMFFDVVLTLHPTSPLRKVEDLKKAIELISTNNCGSVMSVCESLKSPYWMYLMEGNKLKRFVEDGIDYHNLERQQLPKTYQLNGIVYATMVSAIKKYKVMITQDVMGFEVEQRRSISIDDIYEFYLAEMIMKDMLRNKD